MESMLRLALERSAVLPPTLNLVFAVMVQESKRLAAMRSSAVLLRPRLSHGAMGTTQRWTMKDSSIRPLKRNHAQIVPSTMRRCLPAAAARSLAVACSLARSATEHSSALRRTSCSPCVLVVRLSLPWMLHLQRPRQQVLA